MCHENRHLRVIASRTGQMRDADQSLPALHRPHSMSRRPSAGRDLAAMPSHHLAVRGEAEAEAEAGTLQVGGL